jgi:hypothetical protein
MLTYIHPDNLHSCWEFVKEGLARIQSRSPDRWKQEDLYAMVKNGSLNLYVGSGQEGFVFLQLCKGWDAQEVFIFAAYMAPGKAVRDAAAQEIKQLAVNAGARRLKFQSKRNGWLKRAIHLGFKESHIEYEMELS